MYLFDLEPNWQPKVPTKLNALPGVIRSGHKLKIGADMSVADRANALVRTIQSICPGGKTVFTLA